MNDCEAWSERLALRLYGELDASELAELEAHLEGCAGCRAREIDLAAGLGRLRGSVAHAEDDAHARARVRRTPASARGSGAVLVGFAAGVLCALGLAALWRAGAASAGAAPVDAAPAFARATPPPTAQDRGLGVALAAVSRR